MEKFAVGKICYMNGYASKESLRAYSTYRSRGLPLKCPCLYTKGEPLIIENLLPCNLVLLQPKNYKGRLTIAVRDNLTMTPPSTTF